MQLGLVTYNIAKDWDLPTLLANCEEVGLAGVELRTTHAHGVEPSLDGASRAEVRRRFADSPVALWALGTTCEFDSPEPAEVAAQIETARQFIGLAADVGARGVKVRPNKLHEGIAPEDTCRQIGASLAVVGAAAAEAGVSVFVEVHGRGTCDPKLVQLMLDACGHPSVGACWNSNPNEFEISGGSIAAAFGLLADDVTSVHINELWKPEYPWAELFALLDAAGYDGLTLAEIPDSPDPLRLLRYYRALWSAYQP